MKTLLSLFLLFFSTLFGSHHAVVPTPSPLPHMTKICPSGYILVPGNTYFHTADFCVMKYDAKCTNTDPKCVTYEGVYRNDAPGCSCNGTFSVVSTPNGAPITYIPEDNTSNGSAKKYCERAGGHLITNPEWMTIARNVEQVSNNWCNTDGTGCGNSPGTPGKILANGHNDSVPYRALQAGNDNQPCFGTTADGGNVCGKTSSQKRTLQVSSGNIIWDFAGNVWQWIDVTIPLKNEPLSLNPQSKFTQWVWEEFQSVPYDPNNMPSNPHWNSAQGVGRVFHYSYEGNTDPTLYTFIRAGNWRHGYDSGAFTYHEQPVPSKTRVDDVGFRCVTSPS